MRMSPSDAFDAWAKGDMLPSLNDTYPRLETIKIDYTNRLEEDLEYAFQAGWDAALRNLTTSDI